MIGVVLFVERQRDLKHLRASFAEFRFGFRKELLGGDVSFHHETKFRIVELFTEAPGAVRLPFCKVGLEPLREVLEGGDGGRNYLVEPRFQGGIF